MAIKDGGPAFPCERKERVRVVTEGIFDPNDPRNFAVADASYPGLSLRDHFAGQALAGKLAGGDDGHIGDLARYAYQMADAMLAAREQE